MADTEVQGILFVAQKSQQIWAQFIALPQFCCVTSSGRHCFSSIDFCSLTLFGLIAQNHRIYIKYILKSMLRSCGQSGVKVSLFQWDASDLCSHSLGTIACPCSAEPSVGNVSSFNSDLLVKMA